MALIIGIINAIGGKGRGSMPGVSGDFILTEDGARITTENLESLIQE